MTVTIVGETSAAWTKEDWHGVQGVGRQWRCTPEGILVRGESGPRLAMTQQDLAQKVWDQYGTTITTMAEVFDVEPRTILAMICVESAGKADASRFEKALNDYSFGLCQTLTATAYGIGTQIGVPKGLELADEIKKFQLPGKPVPQGGGVFEWKTYLFEPWNSIMLGTAYLRVNNDKFHLQGDPILLYASYNAGSLRPTNTNQWGLVNYGVALDAFANFFGRASLVVSPGPVA